MEGILKTRWETAAWKTALTEALSRIDEGDPNWGHSLSGIPGNESVFHGRDLRCAQLLGRLFPATNMDGADFSFAELDGARFDGTSLVGAKFFEATLRRAQFRNTHMDNANMAGVTAPGATFQRASCDGVDFDGAVLTGAWFEDTNCTAAMFRGFAQLDGLVMENCQLEAANFRGANIVGGHLIGVRALAAQFAGANLTRIRILGGDFQRAEFFAVHLTGAVLEGGANFTSVIFASTDLRDVTFGYLRFDAGHPARDDLTNAARRSFRDRNISWARTRQLGQLPLFAVSWVALFSALAFVNGIGWVNEHRGVLAVGSHAPPPFRIPNNMMLSLLDTVLLAMGSLVYRLSCPDTIQHFTETQWVDQLGHARLQYWADAQKRRGLALGALLLMAGGAALGLYLIGDKLFHAVRYIAFQEGYGALVVVVFAVLVVCVAGVQVHRGSPLAAWAAAPRKFRAAVRSRRPKKAVTHGPS